MIFYDRNVTKASLEGQKFGTKDVPNMEFMIAQGAAKEVADREAGKGKEQVYI